MSGIFIVLEGPDGSGTTSHSKALAESLAASGVPVLHTFEATNGPIGTYIREHLKAGDLPGNALQLLFTADRAWHEKEVIQPALERGETVVCDRYSLSTLVYGEAQGFDRDWLVELNKNFIQPDLLLLALPTFETCMERLGVRVKDSFESNDTLQKRVYALYAEAAGELPADCVIDTSGDIDHVSTLIMKTVQKYLY
jgi:dTMP kinase